MVVVEGGEWWGWMGVAGGGGWFWVVLVVTLISTMEVKRALPCE